MYNTHPPLLSKFGVKKSACYTRYFTVDRQGDTNTPPKLSLRGYKEMLQTKNGNNWHYSFQEEFIYVKLLTDDEHHTMTDEHQWQ